MDLRFETFCCNVCSQVRHATYREKKAIRQELADHLQDHADALMAIGRDEKEAGAAAVAAMGDPKEIGRALNKEYPLVWLLLSRIAALLVIVLLLQLLCVPTALSCAWDNLSARRSPPGARSTNAALAVQHAVDYRFDAPANDVLYIYSLDLQKKEYPTSDGFTDGYMAVIAMCVYDKNLFGDASHELLYHTTFTGGAYDHLQSSLISGSTGARYQALHLPVDYGMDCIYVDYSGFGYEMHGTLPLDWEGVP